LYANCFLSSGALQFLNWHESQCIWGGWLNPQWFGDSFDIVKRYFVENLKQIGYHVIVDPMFTGKWNGDKNRFYHFLGASALGQMYDGKTALLLDPDTGIGKKETKRHVTINTIASHLKTHEIVFSFDQSFSRVGSAADKMKEKLSELEATGNVGFYYDSHARFLFAANTVTNLNAVEQQLILSGLPENRLLDCGTQNKTDLNCLNN